MRQLLTCAPRKRAFVLVLRAAFMAADSAGFARLNTDACSGPVPPTVVVTTQSAGQRAEEEIERCVTIPIEVGLSGAPILAKVHSPSLSAASPRST